MSRTRRNHYLPQRYQLGFANTSGKLWVYDRKLTQLREGTPINTGVEKDFYTVNKDGESSDVVEKMLSQVEGATWPVIDRLSKGLTITQDDRVHLALFVALMRSRTPAFEQMSSGMGNLIFQTLAKLRFASPAELAEEHRTTTGTQISESEAQVFYDAIQNDEFFVETPRQNNIKLMLQVALQLAEALFEMSWAVYRSDPSHTFLTSDNPFVVTSTKPQDSGQGIGPLSPDAVTILPLTATTTLCAQNYAGQPLTFRRANRDFVRQCNNFVAASSDRFIIGRDQPLVQKTVQRVNADKWRNQFVPTLVSPLAPIRKRTSSVS